MKKYISILLALFCITTAYAQTKKQSPKVKANLTFMSQHMWRGIPSGTAPAIEPSVTWTHKGLSLNVWAAYAIDNSYTEVDFIVSYKYKNFEIGLSDFYCPVPNTTTAFSNTKQGETEHQLDAHILYRFLPKKQLKVMLAVAVWGADWDKKLSQLPLGGYTYEQRYSTYLEASYDFKLSNGMTISPEIGFTPFEGMYANKAMLYNYGITLNKAIAFGKSYKLPTSYKLVYNAHLDAINFVFGFTI